MLSGAAIRNFMAGLAFGAPLQTVTVRLAPADKLAIGRSHTTAEVDYSMVILPISVLSRSRASISMSSNSSL